MVSLFLPGWSSRWPHVRAWFLCGVLVWGFAAPLVFVSATPIARADELVEGLGPLPLGEAVSPDVAAAGSSEPGGISTPRLGALSGAGGGIGSILGGLGGLAGNLFQGPGGQLLMVLLLSQLLQQLFGGQSTAQGPVEEQPPLRQPRIIQQRTGSRATTGGGAGAVATQSLTISEGTLYPASAQIARGSALTIYNLDEAARELRVRRRGETTIRSSHTIPAEAARSVRFDETAILEILLGDRVLGAVVVGP